MTIWVTSDQHINNRNIWQKFSPDTRPFSSQEEHDDTIIARWNERVKPDDIVINCGDFIMGQADKVESYLNRLNGFIILVRGNHDTDNKIAIYEQSDKIIEICQEQLRLFYNDTFFQFCHYPAGYIDDRKRIDFVPEIEPQTDIYCYGHIHQNAPNGIVDKTFHVGVDTNDLYPISLDEIIEMYEPLN